MSPVRGVIFDYGNTLVRIDPSAPSVRTDYADVVARPGAERLRRFLEGLLGRRLEHSFVETFLTTRERNRRRAEAGGCEITALESLRETLEGLGVSPPPARDLERAIEEYFAPEIELIRPMPGAAEAANRLRRQGIRVGILSNATSGAYILDVVGRMGWSGLFEPVVVSADIGFRKPRPEAFRAVLDRWPLHAGEVAMVGDSLYHDVSGAQAAGIRGVHFTAIVNPFDGPYRDRVRPWLSVSTHEELLRALAPSSI